MSPSNNLWTWNDHAIGWSRMGDSDAALAGFLPLVVANGAGAHSQQSLGTVIFGGLVVATVLSLGVVPPVYVLVKNLENRLFSRQDAPAQQAEA